jgi:hypothetical protein
LSGLGCKTKSFLGEPKILGAKLGWFIMAKDEKMTQEEWHRKQAVDLFNYTWTLLDKEKRTPEEDEEMVNASHASRYHWEVRVKNGWDATPINRGRGDWQLSRVYAVLKRAEPAIRLGKRYLEICEQEGVKDWDLAYAYEAIARGYAVAGDKANTAKYLELAKKTTDAVDDKDTREMIIGDLKTIPGF